MPIWKILNKKDNNAEILLYDEIANDGANENEFVSAKKLIDKLKEFKNLSNITLRINSFGGEVFEAQAMYSYLKNYDAFITAKIDGIAASAASLVAMSANKIIMPENSLMMIHNPAGACFGDADNMRETAKILDIIRETIAKVYIAKSGLSREKVLELMDAETWLTAGQAYELKLCDEVETATQITAMVSKNKTIFKNLAGFSRVDENLSEKILANSLKINIQENILKKEQILNMNDMNEELKQEKFQEEKAKNEIKEIKNSEDLEKAYPELIAEIKNAAILSERERLKTLDKLNAHGREEIIAKAKYEDIKDARDIAMDLLMADESQMKLNALRQDSREFDDVLTPMNFKDSRTSEQAAMNAVVNEINRMRGIR